MSEIAGAHADDVVNAQTVTGKAVQRGRLDPARFANDAVEGQVARHDDRHAIDCGSVAFQRARRTGLHFADVLEHQPRSRKT
ncbi:MAG TPA: hypothetical protein VK659_24825, partial [Asanoa sp.]|nr:hypothetical protein [Asanoa sp.]